MKQLDFFIGNLHNKLDYPSVTRVDFRKEMINKKFHKGSHDRPYMDQMRRLLSGL